MKWRGQVLVLIVVLGTLLSGIQFGSNPAKANPFTVVTVELPEEPVEADVSPESSGVVEVDGQVTCKKYGPDQVKVYLQAQSGTGGASVVPPSLVFGGVGGTEETRPFTVTTRVPTGYTSSATPMITVGGYYIQGGLQYEIQPASVLIIILQYYEIGVFIEDREMTVKSGDTAYLEFRIINPGNGNDTFQIDFKNREYLQSKGFKLPAPLEVQMAEDANTSISLEIGAQEANSGVYLTEVSVLSKGSLSSDSPEEVIIPIHLKVTSNLGGQIGSIVISPLTIVIIAIVIVVVVFLKLRRREKITSTVN